MSLLELFCPVDDFCMEYSTAGEGTQLGSGHRKRDCKGNMYLSEIMTILIHFHQSHYRNFKAYYTEHVQVNLRREFPKLVSYSRFVELVPRAVVPLGLYIQRCMGQCTGLSFIDSTALAVSHNRRIHSHRVFEGKPSVEKRRWAGFMGLNCT